MDYLILIRQSESRDCDICVIHMDHGRALHVLTCVLDQIYRGQNTDCQTSIQQSKSHDCKEFVSTNNLMISIYEEKRQQTFQNASKIRGGL
jgi:biotin synthase-related radical SAM superfamily protein